jgi:hypothetical protein
LWGLVEVLVGVPQPLVEVLIATAVVAILTVVLVVIIILVAL